MQKEESGRKQNTGPRTAVGLQPATWFPPLLATYSTLYVHTVVYCTYLGADVKRSAFSSFLVAPLLGAVDEMWSEPGLFSLENTLNSPTTYFCGYVGGIYIRTHTGCRSAQNFHSYAAPLPVVRMHVCAYARTYD